jgi:hypothetical protein
MKKVKISRSRSKRPAAFFAFFLVFFVGASVFAQDTPSSSAAPLTPRVTVANYLKSRFFGTTVDFADAQGSQAGTGTPVELIVSQDGYFFNIQDAGHPDKIVRTEIVFEYSFHDLLSMNENPDQLAQRQRKEQIKADTFFNSAIQPLMDDNNTSDTTLSSASLDSMPNTNAAAERLNEVKGGEQVSVLNQDTGEKKKAAAVIINDRIQMSDGTPLTVRFERQSN